MHDTTIEVRNLSFRYPSATEETLREISFTLRGGEVYGFLGPSGAGKSTTQMILYRMLTGYSGEISLFGPDLTRWDTSFLERIGIVFETPNLYVKLTGRENLAFALALRGRSGAEETSFIDIAAERLGLTDALDHRVETYSKGMRMRLSFIRAILHNPPLLFLDEPTSGLDPYWARHVKDWILELRRAGVAVFLTTHAMELADELCDTVAFLVDGRLAVQENPALLKQRFGNPGIVVRGSDHNGTELVREFAYGELRGGPFAPFREITEVRNRDVSLETVFLAVTGRTLNGSASAPANRPGTDTDVAPGTGVPGAPS
jgi:fluoroquinolone transport system ATP-binding protein